MHYPSTFCTVPLQLYMNATNLYATFHRHELKSLVHNQKPYVKSKDSLRNIYLNTNKAYR